MERGASLPERVAAMYEPATEHAREKRNDRSTEPLEERVERLEDAVATLLDAQLNEERLVDRVTERLRPSTSVGATVAAEHVTTERSSAMPERQFFEEAALNTIRANVHSRGWLLVDFVAELRDIMRMFFDIHYRVAWSTRAIVLILVPMILLVDWWLPFPNLPLIGPLVRHTVILIGAFLVYKALSREARRYVETKGLGS